MSYSNKLPLLFPLSLSHTNHSTPFVQAPSPRLHNRRRGDRVRQRRQPFRSIQLPHIPHRATFYFCDCVDEFLKADVSVAVLAGEVAIFGRGRVGHVEGVEGLGA